MRLENVWLRKKKQKKKKKQILYIIKKCATLFNVNISKENAHSQQKKQKQKKKKKKTRLTGYTYTFKNCCTFKNRPISTQQRRADSEFTVWTVSLLFGLMALLYKVRYFLWR